MHMSRIHTYRSSIIHTWISDRHPAPFWSLAEIEAALGHSVDITDTWMGEVDWETLGVESEDVTNVSWGSPLNEKHPARAIVFPTGLTLACAQCHRGAALRRMLLDGTHDWAAEHLGWYRVGEEVGTLLELEHSRARGRKARAVHRAVEVARRSGHLRQDDTGYAECMATVAEIATGLRFPVNGERSAREMMGESEHGLPDRTAP
jgi:hypothetical protein